MRKRVETKQKLWMRFRDENSATKCELSPKYQAIVGGLLFIARMTRPEISIHVNLLGRKTKDASSENWKAVLGVLRFLRSRWAYLKDSRRPRSTNIRRRSLRRGEVKIPDRSPSNSRKPADRLVQQEAGRSLIIGNGSGVYSGLRGSEGRSLDPAIPSGTRDNDYSDPLHRQRGSLQSQQSLQVRQEEQAYRTSIPLSPPATTSREAEDSHNPGEGQSSGPPNETTPDDDNDWIEGIMDEYLRTLDMSEVPILSMTEGQLRDHGMATWTLE